MKIYTIYKATSKTTGKCYIGFDSNYPNRVRIHKSSAKTQDCKFYRAIRKYGWDDFTWEILFQSTDREYVLNAMEPHFINEYNSFNDGYNSTLGGDGTFGKVLSVEARQLISIKNQVSKPQTKEHIHSRMESLKKNPLAFKGMLGKTHTDLTKHLISTKLSGKPKSEEHIENMKTRPQDTTNLTCEHCGKSGDYKNMKRWHGDRCKYNINRLIDLEKLVTCDVCGFTTQQSPNFYRYHNTNCVYDHNP